MAENADIRTLFSVHIMLPEPIDRRLQRWTHKMPGASWPAWGGHVTLVPNFMTPLTVEAMRVLLQSVCAEQTPFGVRFGAPLAVQDITRPDYFAVFLTVEDDQGAGEGGPLHQLRALLLAVLEPVREDARPVLLEQSFLPHVTLALGLGEVEANRVVKSLRAEAIMAEFTVATLWLVTQSPGARFERYPVALGRVVGQS